MYFRLLEIEVNTLKRGDSQFEAFLDQHRSKIERQLIRLKHLKVVNILIYKINLCLVFLLKFSVIYYITNYIYYIFN